MLGSQKERLVYLVQNFFIRSVGYYENVGNIPIDMRTWEVFSNDLNSAGSIKSPYEWKNVRQIETANVNLFTLVFQYHEGESTEKRCIGVTM